jgi:fumarate hydratase subunit beta
MNAHQEEKPAMITCTICKFETELDDVALGGPSGRCVCLRCFNRETGDGTHEALYLNPTTSTRYSAWMPRLIEGCGLRLVGGKGGLDAASVRALQRQGCVYLSFLGGGCTLLSQAIRRVVAVHWSDYISQFRLVTLEVDSLGPATVAIDARGNSIYEQLHTEAAEQLRRLQKRPA